MALTPPASKFNAESAAVTQPRLLVMLYDRLARDLDDAEVSIRTGDRYGANIALLHAQEIVSELECALDKSVWSAARELSSVYLYIQGRLVRANVAQDLAALEQCRVAIEPLHDAWTEVWRAVSRGDASASSAAAAAEQRTPDGVAVAVGTPVELAFQRMPLDVTG